LIELFLCTIDPAPPFLSALKRESPGGRSDEKIANMRRDWHFKLADNIFVEDINFLAESKGIFRKISLDCGIGQFINEILPFVCWKRHKYYLKVDKIGVRCQYYAVFGFWPFRFEIFNLQ
jgi:hypothetical protein